MELFICNYSEKLSKLFIVNDFYEKMKLKLDSHSMMNHALTNNCEFTQKISFISQIPLMLNGFEHP